MTAPDSTHTAAILIIDAALPTMTSRDLVSTLEVSDILLELRHLLAPPAEVS